MRDRIELLERNYTVLTFLEDPEHKGQADRVYAFYPNSVFHAVKVAAIFAKEGAKFFFQAAHYAESERSGEEFFARLGFQRLVYQDNTRPVFSTRYALKWPSGNEVFVGEFKDLAFWNQ